MKKFLKVLFFVVSFTFLLINVNAGVCDAHAIYTKGDLYDFDWAVPMDNICQLTKSAGMFDSGCNFADYGAAQSSCEGYSTHPCTGEVSYRTNGCRDESICNCFDCEYTCNYLEPYCSSHTCACGTKPEKSTCCCQGWRPASWTEAEMLGSSGCLKDSNAGNTWLNNMMGKCKSYKAGQGAGKCNPKFKTRYPTWYCDSSTGGRGSIDSIYDYEHYTNGIYGHISAYCVNPDEAVPKSTNVYPIDATKCINSYSTVDCGFANILIEGNYRRVILGQKMYDYAVILTALRLWAVHVGASGYDLVGFGQNDESQNTAGDPNEWLRFVPNDDGSFDNMYKLAYHNLMYERTYGIRGQSVYNSINTSSMNNLDGLKRISLSSAGKGVFSDGSNQPGRDYGVSDSSGRYLYSYQLLLNTIQGNDKMQDHLNELNFNASGITKEEYENREENGDMIFNDPVSSYTDLVNNKTIKVTYRLRKDVEIDCNTLDEDTANDAGCEIEQKVTIYDKNGNVVETAQAYDYCKKNICYKEFTYDGYTGTLECEAIDKIIVETDSWSECGEKSVNKYIDCANPRDSQMLVSFEADQNCKEPSKTKKQMITYLQCDICKEVTETQANSCYTYSETEGYKDSKAVVTKEITNPRTGKKINVHYTNNFTQDPSLNCILHKRAYEDTSLKEEGRAYYEYSDMFKVNTDICKIYCSDSVNYYLPAREDVNSSLQLKYDIESWVFNERSINELNDKSIQSIVVVERNCVSKIFYDQSFDYNNNWDVNYGLGDTQLFEHFTTFYRMSSSSAQSEVNKIKNACGDVTDFKSLFCRLNYMALRENSRRELLNSLIYDLYNCNMFTQAETLSLTGNKITKPKDAERDAKDLAKDIINNTKTYCDSHDCVTGGIRYEGGAEYFTDPNDLSNGASYDGLGKFSGEKGGIPSLSTDILVSDDLEIKYCSNSEGADGTKIGCFVGSDSNGDFKDNMEYATDSSKFGTLNMLGSNVKVPTNDFMVFKFRVEGQIYNNTRFYSEQFTGKVRNEIPENSSLYDGKYLKLDPFVYPVSSVAQNMCANNSIYNIGLSSEEMSSLCDINYNFSIPIITQYNKDKKKLNYQIAFERKAVEDELYRGMLNTNKYYCNYGFGELEGKIGFAYKNIDISDPFPIDRTLTNWSYEYDENCYDGKCDYYQDKNGNWVLDPDKAYYKDYIKSNINEIKDSADAYMYATEEYKEYSYKLDAESIEAIRKYNDDSEEGYYELPYDCTYTLFGREPEEGEEDKRKYIYLNCNSEFLDKLHSSDNPFDVEVLKDDGISDHTKEMNGVME